MTQEENVSLETDPLEEDVETSPASPPVIVIQYRNRGVPWFVVIALLVALPLISLAFYHRVMSRRRSDDPQPAPRQSANPLATGVPGALAATDAKPSAPALTVPSASLSVAPVALALNTQPIAPGSLPALTPPPTTARPGGTTLAPATGPVPGPADGSGPKAENPKPKSEPAPAGPKPGTLPTTHSSVAPILAIPKPPLTDDNPFAELDISSTPAASVHETPKQPVASSPTAGSPGPGTGELRPPPSKEELLRDIKAEAVEKRQELNQLRNMKDHARDELAAEALDRTDDERVQFRRELREIIKSGSRTTGQDIQTLCAKYGSNYDPELREKLNRQLRKQSTARMTLDARANLLRHFGMPESGILDYLANEVHHSSYGSRNGPRTKDQVLIIAATQLLKTRLPRNNRGSGAGPQQEVSGASAATKPAAAPANALGR
jgi:hypothetical protein